MSDPKPFSISVHRQPDGTWNEVLHGEAPDFTLSPSQLQSFIQLALVQLDQTPVLAA